MRACLLPLQLQGWMVAPIFINWLCQRLFPSTQLHVNISKLLEQSVAQFYSWSALTFPSHSWMPFRNSNVTGAEPKRQLEWCCPLMEAEEFNSTNFFPYHVLRARSFTAIVMAEFLPPVDSGTAKRENNIVTINELKGELLCLFSWYDYSGLLKLVRIYTRAGVTVWCTHTGTGHCAEGSISFPVSLRPTHFCQVFLFTAGYKAKQGLKNSINYIKIYFEIKAAWETKRKECCSCEEPLKRIGLFRMDGREMTAGYKIMNSKKQKMTVTSFLQCKN